MSGAGQGGALTMLLWEYAAEASRAALTGVEGLEALLARHLASGREAWPAVSLPTERFVRHLARHLPAENLAEGLEALHAADLYLACACADGERHALLAFEQHVLQRVGSRLGALPASSVDEVLQVLRQRLLLGRGETPPKIADYSGRGPLLAWVRISAVRVAGELASRDGREELFHEAPEVLERMLAPADPERELLKEDSRQALSAALRQALGTLSARERTLLRLHHVHGLTMDRLAAMYGEPRSTVAYHVGQARKRLLKLTRAALSSRLKLEGAELDSLLGLVRSRLELSLHRLME